MAPDATVEELILRIHCAESPEAQSAIIAELTEGGAELAERIAEALPALAGDDASAACRALGIIGPDARAALPALEEVAARRSMLVVKSHEASAAERAMVCIRADEPEFVLEALGSQRSGLRMGAVDAIATGRVDLSDDAAGAVAETLAEMLDARDRGAANRALEALGALGSRAAPALPRLTELATAPDAQDDPAGLRRLSIVHGLGALGESGLSVGPLLAQLLTDRRHLIRGSAMRLLRRVGPQSADAIAPLLRALTFESPPVGMAGPDVAEMAEELQQSVREGLEEARRRHQAEVRATAAWALGEIGEAGERVLPALAQAARSTAVRLRYHAVTALGRIGEGSDEVSVALGRALADDTAAHVRRAAARAMGLIRPGGQRAVERLAAALEDVETRKSAAWALRRFGESAWDAAPLLVDALDGDSRRRRVVVRALAAIGPDVMQDLREGLHRDGKWQRIGCAEVVAELGPEGRAAERSLRELLFDRRPDVREAAQGALERISADRAAQSSEGDDDE